MSTDWKQLLAGWFLVKIDGPETVAAFQATDHTINNCYFRETILYLISTIHGEAGWCGALGLFQFTLMVFDHAIIQQCGS